MCPIFASSASNCLTRYRQILSGYSFGCKNALNFTCLPMEFHNCLHTTHHTQDGYEHGREGKKPMLGASKEGFEVANVSAVEERCSVLGRTTIIASTTHCRRMLHYT